MEMNERTRHERHTRHAFGNSGRSPATSGVAIRKRLPTLTSDNQMMPKPNLALNGEIEKAVAERLTGPEIIDPRAAADWENTE